MKIKIGIGLVCAFFLLSATHLSHKKYKKNNCECTNLIIVRHAEKNNETDTSTLSAIGNDRADRLAQFLVNTDLSSIYATPFVRMHLTAKPTAVQHKLAIQDYQPHDLTEIERIINANLRRTVLIVGHSNSIPEILNHYTATGFETLKGYNDIFVLQISNAKARSNTLLHFYY